MKKLLLTLTLFLPLTLAAQCDQLISRAERDIDQRLYQDAIKKLLLLQEECPRSRERIGKLIQRTFALITEEKKWADSAFTEAEKQRQRAEEEKLNAQRQTHKADSALEVANRVLDQMYFYEGKFGLTLKDIGSSQASFSPFNKAIYKFGYINKKGEAVLPFKYDEAFPFMGDSASFSSPFRGFAKVKIDNRKFLLDTSGTVFSLAEHYGEFNNSTEAIFIDPTHSISFFQDPFVASPGSNFLTISFNKSKKSKKSFELSLKNKNNLKLLFINLGIGYRSMLEKIPISLASLDQLQLLNINGNSFSHLPQEIYQLKQLKILEASTNLLSSLSSEIGQLRHLENLNLSLNRLDSIPKEIDQLKNLQQIDLRGNPITHFPSGICHVPQIIVDDSLKPLLFLTCQEPWLADPKGRPLDLKLAHQLGAQKEYDAAYRVMHVVTERLDSTYYHNWFGRSWYALFSGEYEDAIASAEKSLELNPEATGPYTNLAHAYVLSGAFEKAKAIYEEWKDQSFPNDERPGKEVFLEDLDTLESKGITHPDFAKVRALLQD